jgi:hypothetical protein
VGGCIDVLSAPRLTSTAAFADEHGLLIGGYIDTPERPGAYLLRVDASGAIVWRRDFAFRFGVAAIVAWKDGHAVLLHGSTHSMVLGVSLAGEVTTIAELASEREAPLPHTMLEHEGRLLLAGERARDLWVGRLGEAGALETTIVEDGHGFGDSVVQLLASEDELVVLARVGLASGTDYDLVGADPSETHVISYSLAGDELGRARLSSDDEGGTTVGVAMTRGQSGSIVVAGYRTLPRARGAVEVRAWAASVVGSEIEWLKSWAGPARPDAEPPFAMPSAAARVGPEVVLAGHVQTAGGGRRWHLRIDPATGELRDEHIGTEITAEEDGYRAAAIESDRAAWFVGDRHASWGGPSTLWACRLSDAGAH